MSAQNVSPPAASENTDDEKIVELSPFQVNDKTDSGYAATESMGASRFAQNNLDVAGSIITVNSQMLQDTAATEALEAMAYVSGVQPASDRHPGHTQYSLRGYALGGVNVRDGLSDPGDAADIPIDQASSYERLEIIKGVAGTLYGSHSMGGIVNKVTKWPRPEQRTDLELQVHGGSDQFVRAMVDSSGPLLNGNTGYRVTFAHTDGERYYDEDDAPIQFTDLTALFQQRFDDGRGRIWGRFRFMHYELDREQGWQYLTGFLAPGQPLIVSNPVFAVAKDANIVPEDDISIGDVYQLEGGYENRFGMFGNDWTLRLVARYSDRSGDKSPSYSQGRPVPVDATGKIVTYVDATGAIKNGDNRFVSAADPRVADWRSTLVLRDFRGFRKSGGVNMDLVGDFNTGAARHKIILNSEIGMGESERAFFFWNAANPNNTTAVGNSFSAVNPDFSGINAGTISGSATKLFNAFNGNSRSESFAAGIQDNVSFLDDRLIFVGGARYDYARNTNHRFGAAASLAANDFVIDPTLTTTDTAGNNSFKGGVVYKVTKGVSLFGQLSQTFNPISSINAATGERNPDQEGEMLEFGAKVELLKGRLVATASWFDMELTNVLIAVPLPIEQGGGTVQVPIGAQNTDGYELDVSWEPIDGWTMQFAFSDLSSTDEQGRFFRGVPTEANYSLFTKYDFRSGGLEGCFVGGGYRHNGTPPGDTGNTFLVDANDVVDAFVGYRREKWSLQLNVFNVFGTDAVISTVSDQLMSRYEDTNARLTFRYRF